MSHPITTDRFNPDPNRPYGKGEDGEVFATEAEANAYMTRTFQEAKARGESRGKSVSIINRNRKDRIRDFVSRELDSALESVMDTLTRAVEDGDATAEEIRSTLWSASPDLEEMFDEWMEEAL